MVYCAAMKRFLPFFHGLPVLLAAATAIGAGTNALERTFHQGDVSLTLSAEPVAVSDLDEVDVTLVLTHPDHLDVQLPADFSDRFDGLTLAGSYEGESVAAGGTRRREFHLHAKPVPGAERLRIAPFPVRWRDPDSGAERWFPTRAVAFERRGLLPEGESVPGDIEEDLRPVRIRHSPREWLRWAAFALAALVGAGLLWLLVRVVRHRIRLARMAPRERALLELETLLRRRLAEQGRFKEFYVELTHVVRRYIERRHGIRAPRQTTEEFLQAALASGVFPSATLERLRAFLAAADLVKFAGVQATEETARDSARLARDYLEAEPRDAERKEARP